MSKIDTLILDRDGVINMECERPFGDTPVEFLPGLLEELGRLRDAGFRFFIVTNQSRICHKICTREEFEEYMHNCLDQLEAGGISITGWRHCPHCRDAGCGCRKPEIGMWKSLTDEFDDLDPERCLMVGDQDKDIVFGKTIGARTARMKSDLYPLSVEADYTVESWKEFADLILNDS